MAGQVWLLCTWIETSVIKSFNPYKHGVLLLFIEKQKITQDVKQQNTASQLGLFRLLTQFSSTQIIKFMSLLIIESGLV